MNQDQSLRQEAAAERRRQQAEKIDSIRKLSTIKTRHHDNISSSSQYEHRSWVQIKVKRLVQP